MNHTVFWKAIVHRVRLLGPRARVVTVQHLMLAEQDVQRMQAALDHVGRTLAVQFALQGDAGDIVLLDAELANRVAPQLVHALVEDRPTVLLGSDLRSHPAGLAGEQAQARLQQDLQQQLQAIGLVRRRSAQPDAAHWRSSGLHAVPAATPAAPTAAASQGDETGFDTEFDSRLDVQDLDADALVADQTALLAQVMHGLHDPGTPALAASYGPEANLHFDFQTGLVCVDPLAMQRLRVWHEVPLPAGGVQPQADSMRHELQDVLWSLGLASGSLALLGAPADWWHTPLHCTGLARVERFSRVPQHLELARRLAGGPLTPSALRRQARVSVAELRRFLQACLALQLLQWHQPQSFKEAA